MAKQLPAMGWVVAAAIALFASVNAVSADGPTTNEILVTDEMIEAGEVLYMINCRLCHGTRGTAGVPLAGNERVGDASYIARTILVGPGYMTGFADHLDDEQIALIATYVRNSWGNQFGLVSRDTVAAER